MRLLLISFIVIISFSINAQFELSGKVISETDAPLVGATVVLLNQKDSTMQAFCLSNENGDFILEDVKADAYILQVSYVSYANYSTPLSLEWDSDNIELKAIRLIESTEVLKEVIITAEHIPMGIYGDTLSYNAAAFKTKPNATVEDLLRKLPGIEVERNGNITAQGEDVRNILVDGKEFFGGDPKMATKNLDAIAVDKVKVYDKKSEIAEFTGVDDAKEEKTINLELKEDFKKGTFGNAKVAVGTKETYNTKMNLFRFNPKLQASIILSANNINEETFTINDRIDFMGGFANAIASGTLNLGQQLQLSEGINETLTSGVNFNYDFSSKVNLTTHYMINKGKNINNKNEEAWGFTNDSEFLNTDRLESTKKSFDHALNLKLKVKFNPFTELITQNIFSIDQFESNKISENNYTLNQMEIGRGLAAFDMNSINKSWHSKNVLKHKFKQKGRNIIGSLSAKNQYDDSEEEVYTDNVLNQRRLIIDQNQVYKSKLLLTEVNTSYTEPIGKYYFANLSYAFLNDLETPSKLFFDQANGTEILNEDLSAAFEKSFDFHKVNFSVRRNSKKLKASTGINLQKSRLSVLLAGEEALVGRGYINLLPHVDLDLKVGRNSNATLKYQKTFTAPLLGQLIPFVSNQSANFEYIGNPFLKPTLSNKFNLSFRHFDQFSFTTFIANFDFINSKNKVINKIDIDESLFQSVQAVNTDRHNAMTGYFSFSKPFKPLKLKYEIRIRSIFEMYDGFVNGEVSKLIDQNYRMKFNLRNTNNDRIELNGGIKLDWTIKKFGIKPEFDQSFKTIAYYLDAVLDLPKEIYLIASFDKIYNTNNLYGNEPSYNLIKLDVSKLFFSNKLQVSFIANDLLNQNIGYSRFGDLNSVYETNYQTLTRYFMIGLQYKIGKSKKKGITILNDGL